MRSGSGGRKRRDVELAVGDAIEHEHAFEQRGARRQRRVDQQRGIALFAFEQQVERAGDQRMIEAQQRQVFARERGRAIERDLLRAVLEAREIRRC